MSLRRSARLARKRYLDDLTSPSEVNDISELSGTPKRRKLSEHSTDRGFSATDYAPTNFLDLPQELRDQVYLYYLGDEASESQNHCCIKLVLKRGGDISVRFPPGSLANVNCQLREEVRSICQWRMHVEIRSWDPRPLKNHDHVFHHAMDLHQDVIEGTIQRISLSFAYSLEEHRNLTGSYIFHLDASAYIDFTTSTVQSATQLEGFSSINRDAFPNFIKFATVIEGFIKFATEDIERIIHSSLREADLKGCCLAHRIAGLVRRVMAHDDLERRLG